MNNSKTGALIAARRQALGLTQKDLAKQLHVSDRTVSKWERGAGFPDVSLLEPLADALDLSVLELIHGQRMNPEDGFVPETERSVRELVHELGGRFGQAVRLYRRALIVLTALLLCGTIGFICLWFSPFQAYYYRSKEVSAAEALKTCPFAILTADDFKLSRQILDDPEIAGYIGDIADDAVEISDEIAAPYRELAFIEKQPAEYIEIIVYGAAVYVDYGQENRRCILTIYSDGSVVKTSCAYKPAPGLGSAGSKVGVIVSNQDNVRFTLGWEERDWIYSLTRK